jgi:hypothetical protein
MMRLLVATTVPLALAACVGTPHQDPSEISAAEVSVYKAGMEKGCRDTGHGRGDPPAKVDGFCNCLMSTLNSRLSADDWKKATFYAQQRRDRDEQGVIAPHMAGIQACRT